VICVAAKAMEGICILDWSISGDWGLVRLGQQTGNGWISGNGDSTAIIPTGCCVSCCVVIFVRTDGHRGSTNLGSQTLGDEKSGNQSVYFTAGSEFLLEFDFL
jgi:hypothetical protein